MTPDQTGTLICIGIAWFAWAATRLLRAMRMIDAEIKNVNRWFDVVCADTKPIYEKDLSIDQKEAFGIPALDNLPQPREQCPHCGSPFGMTGEVPVCKMADGCKLTEDDFIRAGMAGAVSINAVRAELRKRRGNAGPT